MPELPPAPVRRPAQPTLKDRIIHSPLWRSVFRGGVWRDTPRDRAQHILGNVWLHLHPARVRKHALNVTYTWGLGGITFLLFLVLTVTGVLLMFYYRPTTDMAFRDMKDLEFAVTLGKFLRNMHRWSAHAMVMFVMLHMARVFLTGSYKTPREFNWVVGVVLLLLTFLLSFTGYLLPWDQLALWAITVGTNMASATPLLGAEGPFSITNIKNDARFALLGGTYVGSNALLRFYVLHCVALPLAAGVFMIVHFWRVRKDTFSGPALKPEEIPHDKVDVWPHLVVREYIAAALTLVVLTAWSVFLNAPLEAMADPNVTPNPSKAPWYFVGLQELLVYFDPWIAGVLFPTLIVIGLMAIPYLDTNQRGVGSYAYRERPFAWTVFLFGLAMWFILILIGQFMRGPNFAWYWPWEDWAVHKPPPPPMWNIPNLWGAVLLLAYFGGGMILPRFVKRGLSWKAALGKGVAVAGGGALLLKLAVRLQFGQIVWLVFFGVVYYIVAFLFPQRYLREFSTRRYVITMAFLLLMMGVLMKMGVRLGFNVKYIFSLPQFNFNI